MLNNHRPIILLVLFALCGGGTAAEAQMFGPRTLGQPFQGRRGAASLGSAASASAANAGIISGSERYLRENRSRNAFVGTDRQSLEGFVGSGQAIGVGRVQTATETLAPPPDLSERVNRPLPPLPSGAMYYPRLVMASDALADGAFVAVTRDKRDAKLEQRLGRAAGAPIEVIHEGGRTILQGTVPSSDVAERLRILASFEPHVDEIELRLRIASQ